MASGSHCSSDRCKGRGFWGRTCMRGWSQPGGVFGDGGDKGCLGWSGDISVAPGAVAPAPGAVGDGGDKGCLGCLGTSLLPQWRSPLPQGPLGMVAIRGVCGGLGTSVLPQGHGRGSGSEADLHIGRQRLGSRGGLIVGIFKLMQDSGFCTYCSVGTGNRLRGWRASL